jgi:RNA polymerase sigma factor (sigma-70 family)
MRSTSSLVAAAQAGDELAFRGLVRCYQDLAVAYATSILGDFHLAEDAAQEAFVDVYRQLAALREPAAFPAWFRTIVFKQCDRLTRRKQLPTSGLDAALAVASPNPSPHDVVEAAETRATLDAAIATLSGSEQEAVLLYYMGDRSHSEIATFLGVTSNAVKTRLYAARQRLRAHMSEIEKRLDAARPSSDSRFTDKVKRLIQPEELKQKKPWIWSPGIGTDVWAMFCACITGDLETVKELVAKDPSLVRAHFEYRTPLSFAVRENQLDVAAYLLDQGPEQLKLGDVLEMARDRGLTEMTALLERRLAEFGASSKGDAVAEAIRDRDLARVRRLLDEQPELLHEGDRRSNQPIHWATMSRQPAMIDEVLARGADINAARADGARPIHLTNGDYLYRGWRDVPSDVTATPDDIYRHLVRRGASVDLGMAALKGDLGRVRALLAEDPTRANRVADYNTYYPGAGAPLKNAAVGGHIEIVRLLLAHGADPNLPEEGIAPRGHALYSAIYNGHHEIAKLLLDHGAYPNPEVESSADAVWIAIRNGDRRALELLASHGATWEISIRLDGPLTYADIVATGVRRPLHIRAFYGDLDGVRELLEENPTLADNPDALSGAAGQGHEAIVRLLLRYQPDLAKRVTVSRPRGMAELLFEHGMDPNRPSWLRITPVHHFAEQGDVESAALFLDHGADIHAREEENCSTPLAWAARYGQQRMVEFLLRRGAKPRLSDDPVWATPRSWATRREHGEIVRILERFEAEGSLPDRTEERFERLASDLVSAYGPGDEAALQRIIDHFRIARPLTWDRPPVSVRVDRLRRAVSERLGRSVIVETLAIDDARLLIARSEGFESWEALLLSSRAEAAQPPESRDPRLAGEEIA